VKRVKHTGSVQTAGAKRLQQATVAGTSDMVTFASCFDLLASALNGTASTGRLPGPMPTAEDLFAALIGFQVHHPTRAAVAMNIAGPDLASVQNAVRSIYLAS